MAEETLSKTQYRTRSAAAYEVKEYYSWEDLQQRNFRYEEKLGDPGQFPFTRGPSAEMYRQQFWTISLYAGYGQPEECNKRYKKLVHYGADCISMAADLPTQIGIDSDHPLADGEVGRVGVAIDTLRDLEIIFKDIAIDKLYSVGMLGNSIGPIALAFFLALAEKKGLKEDQWRITLQNDVLKEYATRGTHIFPIVPAVRVATDVVKYCARKKLLHFKPMVVCGSHMKGAGTPWEIAFALSDAIVYIDHILSSGMKIDEFAPMLRLFLSVGSATLDLFEEVAKARAARRIWAKIMKERYRAEAKESMGVNVTAFIIAEATAYQPINNIARIALGARAAVMAGVESMNTACWDEGLTLPSEEAVQVSIRTQQILRHESGSVVACADPMGGSYFLEDLTDRIVEDVLEKMKGIENIGGAVSAIQKGFYQQQISAGVYKLQRELWGGDRKQVGVNLYRQQDDKIPLGNFKIDPQTEGRKKEDLKKLRRERDNRQVKETLRRVRAAAESDENLVPPILEAVKAYATIGEIFDEMRTVFGEYSEGAAHL